MSVHYSIGAAGPLLTVGSVVCHAAQAEKATPEEMVDALNERS
jgi:hypothetical protein